MDFDFPNYTLYPSLYQAPPCENDEYVRILQEEKCTYSQVCAFYDRFERIYTFFGILSCGKLIYLGKEAEGYEAFYESSCHSGSNMVCFGCNQCDLQYKWS